MVVDYDVIVIGAGIIGSFTAYHLSKAGKRTLILEQFPLKHSRGGSHGHSRITRRSNDHSVYADMMEESFSIWADIEQQTNTKIYIKTGLLEIEDPPFEDLNCSMKNMDRLKFPYEVLNNEEFVSRFPEFVFSSESIKIFDPAGGVLRADRALNAVQKLCEIRGTVFLDECMVTSICPFVDNDGSSAVLLDTNRGKLTSNTLVVCTGAWTGKVLRCLDMHLPIQAEKIWVYYWKLKNPDVHSGNWTNDCDGLPCFRSHGHGQFYMLPSAEYPGYVKLARHDGVPCDPDNRDGAIMDPHKEEIVRFVKEHFPELLEPEPRIIESCIYAVTPDHLCVMDRHPDHYNILIGTGFSGTGFKISPTVGKTLCDLALNAKTPYDIRAFNVSRFRKSSL